MSMGSRYSYLRLRIYSSRYCPRHADRIILTLGANPERIRWGIETARQAAQSTGRDPGELKFGAYVNLVCHQTA